MASVYLVGQDGIRLSHPGMLQTASEFQSRLYSLANKPNYAAIATQMEAMINAMSPLQKHVYWNLRSGTTNEKSAGHAMAFDEILEWGLNRFVQTKMINVLTKSINQRMGVLAEREKRLLVFQAVISNVPETTQFSRKFRQRKPRATGLSTLGTAGEAKHEDVDYAEEEPPEITVADIIRDNELMSFIQLLQEEYKHKRNYVASTRERRLCVALNEALLCSNNTVAWSIRHNVAVAFQRHENIKWSDIDGNNDVGMDKLNEATELDVLLLEIKDFNMKEMNNAVLKSDGQIFLEAEQARIKNFENWRNSYRNYMQSSAEAHLRYADAPNRRKFWDLYQIGLICKIDQWHWTTERFDNNRKKIAKMVLVNRRDSKRISNRIKKSSKLTIMKLTQESKTIALHGVPSQYMDLKLMEKLKFECCKFVDLPLNQILVSLLTSLNLETTTGRGLRIFNTRGETKESGPPLQKGHTHLIADARCFLTSKSAYRAAVTYDSIAMNILERLALFFREVPTLTHITWCFDDVLAISENKSFFSDTLPGGEQ